MRCEGNYWEVRWGGPLCYEFALPGAPFPRRSLPAHTMVVGYWLSEAFRGLGNQAVHAMQLGGAWLLVAAVPGETRTRRRRVCAHLLWVCGH